MYQTFPSTLSLFGSSLDNTWEGMIPASIKFSDEDMTDIINCFDPLITGENDGSDDVDGIFALPMLIGDSTKQSDLSDDDEDAVYEYDEDQEEDDDDDDEDVTENDYDEDESEDDVPMPKRARYASKVAPSAAPAISAAAPPPHLPSINRADKFLNFYKRSVRVCECVDAGTFAVSKPFSLQYLSQTQPIPDNLVCRFKMFSENWRSYIKYVLLEDGKTTGLKFTVLHVESGVETTMVETLKEAEVRRTCNKPRTICNRVFLLALKRCRAYLLALPASDETVSDRLACLSASGTARKCTESISLFGLRSDFMKALCLDFFSAGTTTTSAQ